MGLKNYKKLPVHIVEDHNEALQSIYSAIGSRHLPLNNNLLIHLDSHPDLLVPKEMSAEAVWDKKELFKHLSIESWILPSCYSGQFSNIYWVKPTWSDQIPQGKHKFLIGSYQDRLRVESNLYYFISDGLYACRNDLENKKEVKLNVIEMTDQDSVEELNDYVKKNSRYVLDIDLDYFSTINPFSKMFNKGNLYERLKQLYMFKLPEQLIVDSTLPEGTNQCQLLQKVTKDRNTQLGELAAVFKHLEVNGSLKDLSKDLSVVKKGPIRDIIKCVKEFYGTDNLDWELVQTAGLTCDATELPQHVSTEEELQTLFEKFEEFLKSLDTPPVIITIARSADDEYCPPEQVSYIQENVLNILENLYGELEVEKMYESR